MRPQPERLRPRSPIGNRPHRRQGDSGRYALVAQTQASRQGSKHFFIPARYITDERSDASPPREIPKWSEPFETGHFLVIKVHSALASSPPDARNGQGWVRQGRLGPDLVPRPPASPRSRMQPPCEPDHRFRDVQQGDEQTNPFGRTPLRTKSTGGAGRSTSTLGPSLG